ncbi:MAG: precorrin-2 dehydrogenase/sirohydrochlorin ferrochelatase family protein [Janthinobacterium lividum]
MNLYPISLNLTGQTCLVVGGGKVAERKIKSLLKSGAVIRLVSPDATPALQALAAEGKLEWRREAYPSAGTGMLNGAFLVMACTDNRAVNAEVTRNAQAQHLLVLCADDPNSGNFVSTAQITRGDLVLTVSTGGGSPTLAAVLRERLETEFGPEWTDLVEMLGKQREFVKTNSEEASRKAAIRRVLDDAEVHALLVSGKYIEAEARIRECLLF